jgi:hypothetical protein
VIPYRIFRLALIVCLALAGASAPGAELLSVAVNGTQSGNAGVGESLFVSADGRYVAFDSGSTNLVVPDTNGLRDVFVRDCTLRSNIWGSVAARSSSSSGSFPQALTPDGRFLLFASVATNLVPGATTTTLQLYRHDLRSNVTALVSMATNGLASATVVSGLSANAKLKRITPDGRFVLFLSAATDLATNASTGTTMDAFCRDLANGVTELVSASPDGLALDRAVVSCFMSADGRYFAFDSAATNVVPGLTNTGGRTQVYWRDRQAGTNVLVSLNAAGQFASDGATVNSLSSDGRYVCFSSLANNIVTGQNDFNGTQDLFLRDMVQGETWLVSRATNGNTTASRVSGGEFSADGAWMLLSPLVSDLVAGVTSGGGFGRDLYLHNVAARTNLLVTRSVSGLTGSSGYCSDGFATLSASGRFVVFDVASTNLLPGGTTLVNRLLLRDCAEDQTFTPLPGAYAVPPYNYGHYVITEDEGWVFFLALANYDPAVTDSNGAADVFRARLRAAELRPFVPGGPIQGQGLALGTYILQTSSNLRDWTDAVTNVADSNGVFTVTDPQSPGAQRFFRVTTP